MLRKSPPPSDINIEEKTKEFNENNIEKNVNVYLAPLEASLYQKIGASTEVFLNLAFRKYLLMFYIKSV